MRGEDLDNSFTKEKEYDDLKVILFSEFPLSYPGGGERLIKLLHNSLRSAGINVGIIENTNMIKTVSIAEEKLNITSIKFERFGFMKFLYQDFPPLSTIPSDNNTISLVLLRRVPPRSILKQLMNTNSKVIFCLHGIALEKIRIANPIMVAHQLLIRIQLRDLARYCRNHIGFIMRIHLLVYSVCCSNRLNINIRIIDLTFNITLIIIIQGFLR